MNFKLILFSMAILLVLSLTAGPVEAADNVLDTVKKEGKKVEGKLKEIKETVERE